MSLRRSDMREKQVDFNLFPRWQKVGGVAQGVVATSLSHEQDVIFSRRFKQGRSPEAGA